MGFAVHLAAAAAAAATGPWGAAARGRRRHGRRPTAGAAGGLGGLRVAAQEAHERRRLGEQVAGLASLSRRARSTASRRAEAPAKSVSKREASRGSAAVADAAEDVLEAVDVVLDRGEAHHPAVPLQGVQRAEDGGDRLGVEPFALEGEEAVVEGLEMAARIFYEDGQQLGGDLEVHRLLRPCYPAVIFSMRPWSSEAWKGFFT